MKGDDLLNELRGRTSGESRQELVQFFTKLVDPEVPLPSHEVLLEDGEHALIVKRHIGRDGMNQLAINNAYFLSGVNDEGRYFMHPASYLFASNTSLEDVVTWLNKADEGYSERIQGDVLVQYLATAPIVRAIEVARSDPNGRYGAPGINLELRNSRPQLGQQTVQPPSNIRFEDLVPHTEIRLGNHVLTTTGSAFVDRYGARVLLIGLKDNKSQAFQFMLQHPDHGIKTVEVAEGHAVLLAGQRGRYQGWSGNQAVGFD